MVPITRPLALLLLRYRTNHGTFPYFEIEGIGWAAERVNRPLTFMYAACRFGMAHLLFCVNVPRFVLRLNNTNCRFNLFKEFPFPFRFELDKPLLLFQGLRRVPCYHCGLTKSLDSLPRESYPFPFLICSFQ